MDTVSSLLEMEALEACWGNLTGETGAPFQTFGWNLAWFRVKESLISEMLVFAFRDEEGLAAILPCYRIGNEIRLAGDEFPVCQDLISRDESTAIAALNLVTDWLREEAPTCRLHFESVSSCGWLCRGLGDNDDLIEGVVAISMETNLRPEISIRAGYSDYIQKLPGETNRKLRGALRRIDHEMPCARLEIKRHHEIRVDTLDAAIQFLGEKDGDLSELLPQDLLLPFLGELAKDDSMGLQMARLVDQGDTLAVDIGFSFGSQYFALFYADDETFSDVRPSECLFLSRLNDWISKDSIESVVFPCRENDLAKELTGGLYSAVFTMTLMPESILKKVKHAVLGKKGFRTRSEDTAALPR
ncbi:MAG: GNAT family N-acetyltransferase [Verrucomicrobiales bacterium]|nr:GNAT family N-acetyltransferase [Verrucomicrobiales bacterium]